MQDSEGWFSYNLEAETIRQGTIVFADAEVGLHGKHYVILNPECDLANNKSDYINLIGETSVREAVEDVLSGLSLTSEHWNGLKPLTQKNIDNIIKKLLEQINGKHNPRWFFVPSNHQASGFPLLAFDLQQIYTIESKFLPNLLPSRKAIINSPFKESLVTRLYSYLTRIGTSDTYKEQLCYSIIEAAGLQMPIQQAFQGTGSKNQTTIISDPSLANVGLINASPALSAANETIAETLTKTIPTETAQTYDPQFSDPQKPKALANLFRNNTSASLYFQ